MPDLIRVVLCPVGGPPHEAMIENTRQAFQAFVGGDIEFVGLGDGYGLYCNEDFVALGLPQNGCGLRGPYLFTRLNEAGDDAGLDEADVSRCLAYWSMYRRVLHVAAPLSVETFASLADLIAARDRARYDANYAN